jgi:hypothetical protein
MPRKEIVKIILGPNMLNGWLLLLAHLEPQRIDLSCFTSAPTRQARRESVALRFTAPTQKTIDTKLGRENA